MTKRLNVLRIMCNVSAGHARLAIRLSQLREEQNIKQSEMENFSQTAISKIEKRKDMKISTLIEYLDSLGMGLEIVAYPKIPVAEQHSKVLLKI